MSQNSEITVETSRMINSEISSQMSRKIEEMKSDLNSHILEVINSAIEERILPSIENVITSNREAKNTKWDLRSDGRHPDRNIQMTQNSDLESHGRHKSKFCQQVQDSGENFPKLIATSSNQSNHRRENLVDFEQSDDEGYDTWRMLTVLPFLISAYGSSPPPPISILCNVAIMSLLFSQQILLCMLEGCFWKDSTSVFFPNFTVR